MKTLKNLAMVLFMALAITSCNKSDDDAGDGGGDEGNFSAQVDGSGFNANVAASANETTSGGQTTLVLLGSDASGKAINIIINGFDGVGTYPISSDNVFTSASYTETDVNNPSNTQIWAAPFENSGMVGEINIAVKTDSNVEGTFNFDARLQNGTSMKNVTNGQFNLSL